MEVNPFKIGPLLLCYNEEPFFEGSVFYRLHDRLKKEYNFYLTPHTPDFGQPDVETGKPLPGPEIEILASNTLFCAPFRLPTSPFRL